MSIDRNLRESIQGVTPETRRAYIASVRMLSAHCQLDSVQQAMCLCTLMVTDAQVAHTLPETLCLLESAVGTMRVLATIADVPAPPRAEDPIRDAASATLAQLAARGLTSVQVFDVLARILEIRLIAEPSSRAAIRELVRAVELLLDSN